MRSGRRRLSQATVLPERIVDGRWTQLMQPEEGRVSGLIGLPSRMD